MDHSDRLITAQPVNDDVTLHSGSCKNTFQKLNEMLRTGQAQSVHYILTSMQQKVIMGSDRDN